MDKLFLHSITDVTTNSSSEMFMMLEDDAISKAKTILKDAAKKLGVSDIVDQCEIVAIVEAGDDDDLKRFTCKTDEELRKANAYMHKVQYPHMSEITVKLKGLDLISLFTGLKRSVDLMQ